VTDVDGVATVRLGALGLTLGRVNRITYHGDGVTPESDTDHTVMLGLVACAFAARHLPELDIGLVAQFALVHDLVEAYAGDTPTLRIDSEQKRVKALREAVALSQIETEFRDSYPWLSQLIARYEVRKAPEARYVKAMDKLVPKITHILNGCRTIRDQGMNPTELADRYTEQFYELQGYAADFPALFELRGQLLIHVWAMMEPGAIVDVVEA
jgi:putative hydrolase of HD superfamily